MYYRNAQAAVVVYDVTKAVSLDKAKSWVKELQRQANPNIVIALAGNKVDLVNSSSSPAAGASSDAEDEPDDATATPNESSTGAAESESLRQVPREEAQAYATEAGLLFFETSAKTGEGVVELFTEIGAFTHMMPRFVATNPTAFFVAKKIPIEHILASSRTGNRNAGPGGRNQDQGVTLDANSAKRADACNC